MSLPPSSPQTPGRRLLDLTNEFDFSTPRRSNRYHREIQAGARELVDKYDTLKRDYETAQLAATAGRPTKRRSRGNRVPDTVPNGEQLQKRIRDAGRRYVGVVNLFPFDDYLVGMKLDPNFDPTREFENEKSIQQGQIRLARDMLAQWVPHVDFEEEFVAASFFDGIDGQRSSEGTRVRSQSKHHIVSDPAQCKDLATAATRREAFRPRLGFLGVGADGIEQYDVLASELVHGDVVEKTPNTMFRGDTMVKVALSVLRGQNGAADIDAAHRAQTFEKKYKIRGATPSFIANMAVLTIWMFSADDLLTIEGNQTSLHYGEMQTLFYSTIVKALDDGKEWAFELLAYWNAKLWPNACAGDKADIPSASRLSASSAMRQMLENAPRRQVPASAQRSPPRSQVSSPRRRATPSSSRRSTPSSNHRRSNSRGERDRYSYSRDSGDRDRARRDREDDEHLPSSNPFAASSSRAVSSLTQSFVNASGSRSGGASAYSRF